MERSQTMNESIIKFAKKLVFHYADGRTLNDALSLLRESLPPNKKNLAYPAKVLEAYHFAVEIKRGEQTIEGAIAMLVYHGSPQEEAEALIDLSVNALKNYYGSLHYTTADINCPKCDWVKEVGFHYIGKQIACPSCYEGFTIAV